MTIRYFLLSMLILPAGIVLTIITILRMRTGQIALPKWAKIVLIIGMILSQLIIAVGMMPPSVSYAVKDAFIHTGTHPATPIDPPFAVEPDSAG